MKIGPYRTLDPFPELSYNELIMREAIFRKARQFCKSLVSYKIKAAEYQRLKKSGAEGSRTPVQTSSPKAFYMLIPALIVGRQQEPDKPIVSLAGWSYAAVTAFCCSIL